MWANILSLVTSTAPADTRRRSGRANAAHPGHQDAEGSLYAHCRDVRKPVGRVHVRAWRPAQRSAVRLSSQRPALCATEPAQDDSHSRKARWHQKTRLSAPFEAQPRHQPTSPQGASACHQGAARPRLCGDNHDLHPLQPGAHQLQYRMYVPSYL